MDNEISSWLEKINQLPLNEQRQVLKLLEELEATNNLDEARKKFHPFVKRMWEDFVDGAHIREMGAVNDAIIRGELKRVCINLAPRHSKSKNQSVFLPAKYFGAWPKRKIMQLGNTQTLVDGFGREVRDLIETPDYQALYPLTKVHKYNRAADNWRTTLGGEYLARGVGGIITGKGADLMNIDDPHDEGEAALAVTNPKIFDSTYEWFMAGPRQRFQPGGALLITMTRWGKRDLQGRIIQDAINNGSIGDWKIIEYPAILPSGRALWPEFWPLEELLAVKRDLPVHRWNAQYMQNPTSETGAIVKRDWWKSWQGPKPEFIYKIQSWDTAYSAKTSSDFSACTTWGVFFHENHKGRRVAMAMLIDAWKGRVEFPDLKQEAKRQKAKHSPDTVIIEARSSGASLIQELRSMGIPCEEATPSRGEDKLVRLNAVSDLFASGFIWYDQSVTMCEEVIEEFATFGSGGHDDLMDTGTQALKRLVDGMFLVSANDEHQLYEEDEFSTAKRRRPRLY